jgi:hypothetical protein
VADTATRARSPGLGLQVVQGATHTWHGATMDSPYGYVFFSDRVKAAVTSGG